MNLTKLSSVVTLLIACGYTTAALAGSQASMRVKGVIEPTACDVSLDQGGELNWNDISTADLKLLEATRLEPKEIKLTINCEASALVVVKPTDVAELAGNITLEGLESETLFSLGSTPEGKAIGGWTLTTQAQDATADGDTVSKLVSSDSEGFIWDASAQPISWKATGASLYGIADEKGEAPAMAKDITLGMTATPYIAAKSDLGVTDEFDISGRATFDVVYL